MSHTTNSSPDITYYQIPDAQMQQIAAALRAGLESSRTELADHDDRLGRSIARNKSWAESLERQITEIEKVIAGLPCDLTHP